MVLVPFKTVGKDKQDAKISKSSFKCLILGLLNAQKTRLKAGERSITDIWPVTFPVNQKYQKEIIG